MVSSHRWGVGRVAVRRKPYVVPIPLFTTYPGSIAGPGVTFASFRGALCPETAGITEVPGEFAYTPPPPRGAIIPSVGGIASKRGAIVGPMKPYAFYEGGLCPETAGITEIPGEFAYTPPLPRGAIIPSVGGIASYAGAIQGPGSPFALYRGVLCPETAGITEIPGEFAYTPPLPRGAIIPSVGGIASKRGAIVNSIGGG